MIAGKTDHDPVYETQTAVYDDVETMMFQSTCSSSLHESRDRRPRRPSQLSFFDVLVVALHPFVLAVMRQRLQAEMLCQSHSRFPPKEGKVRNIPVAIPYPPKLGPPSWNTTGVGIEMKR